MSTLQGEIALVTGASRGIGAAIADELAAMGATVVGTATSEAGAAAIEARLAPHGGRGRVLDVTDAAAVDALIEDVAKQHGAISILVNNAGITRDQLLMRMSEEDFTSVLDTNLTGTYRVVKRANRGMLRAKKGRVVLISSVVGLYGGPGQANYAASKAALVGFARSLARELGSRNITFNVVAPGFVDTDMTRALTDEQRADIVAQVPLGRYAQPEEIAATVRFLASDDASYITGAVIPVDGGLGMGH
jgi:3-oxoacyl-[acyl-carrier protein] reductase